MTLHGNVNKTIDNPEHINSSIERCELQVISMVVPGVHYRSNSSYLQCMVPIASYRRGDWEQSRRSHIMSNSGTVFPFFDTYIESLRQIESLRIVM